jgi:4-aminobutyrate aminotransferase/(S)-3-amino-2-methylpropionate transaminase
MKSQGWNKNWHDARLEIIPNGHTSSTTCYVAAAQGAIIRDGEGNEYIDFAGGIGVMNIGHSHPNVVAAIKTQVEKFTHTCFAVAPYDAPVRLAQRLAALTPGKFAKKVMFLNSGAEAVENAVKIARYFTKRPAIIVFENAYHGRTLLTMSMTSKVKPYKLGFGPFAPEIYRMPYGDAVGPDHLKDFFIKNVNPEAVAAVVAEPVQGEGGFVAPPPGYFQQLTQICHEQGILFICDEIQSGMGRTGRMFAIEHWGVEPDLICVAKSLAAGMPLSAVVGRQEIMDSVHDAGLGGTYVANPVACEAALAVLDVFEREDMLNKSVILGQKLRSHLEHLAKRYPIVGGVRGLGAMLGIELIEKDGMSATDLAKQLATYCFENGLIILVCGSYGNIVRLLPPFVITDEQLAKAFDIMESGLAHISGRVQPSLSAAAQ